MKVFTGESKSGLISQSHNCGGWTQWVRSAVNRKKHWPSSSALTPHPSLVLLLCLHARRGVHSVESMDWNPSSVSDKNGKKWHMWNHIPPPRDCNDQLEAKNVKIAPLLTYVKKLIKAFLSTSVSMFRICGFVKLIISKIAPATVKPWHLLFKTTHSPARSENKQWHLSKLISLNPEVCADLYHETKDRLHFTLKGLSEIVFTRME